MNYSEEKPQFRLRYPKVHFQRPGKFYRSGGDTDLSTTINYIRGQKEQAILDQIN